VLSTCFSSYDQQHLTVSSTLKLDPDNLPPPEITPSGQTLCQLLGVASTPATASKEKTAPAVTNPRQAVLPTDAFPRKICSKPSDCPTGPRSESLAEIAGQRSLATPPTPYNRQELFSRSRGGKCWMAVRQNNRIPLRTTTSRAFDSGLGTLRICYPLGRLLRGGRSHQIWSSRGAGWKNPKCYHQFLDCPFSLAATVVNNRHRWPNGHACRSFSRTLVQRSTSGHSPVEAEISWTGPPLQMAHRK